MEAKTLAVYTVMDYSMGPYNYYVVTPEGDWMYFEEKKQARAFIEFYHNYTTQKQTRKVDNKSSQCYTMSSV